MLPSLPQEIFDLIVDDHQQTTLKSCLLVSNRALCASEIIIFRLCLLLVSWTKVFLDPSNPPARHACSIRIDASAFTAIASSHARPWVRSFLSLWLFGHRIDGRVFEGRWPSS